MTPGGRVEAQPPKAERPLVLVTNDDGVDSPGIAAAISAVIDFAEVVVVAPLDQQTSMSRAFPLTPEGGIVRRQVIEVGGHVVPAFGVGGSPALVMAHAVLELTSRLPALCVSGVNYGENVGCNVSVSGTVGAALEAEAYGVPAIAISQQVPVDVQKSRRHSAVDWDASVSALSRLVQWVLLEGFPADVSVLNVNVPESANVETSMRITRLSRQPYYRPVHPGRRDWDVPITLDFDIDVDWPSLEADSDIRALSVEKVVSVTPLHWDLSRRSASTQRLVSRLADLVVKDEPEVNSSSEGGVVR